MESTTPAIVAYAWYGVVVLLAALVSSLVFAATAFILLRTKRLIQIGSFWTDEEWNRM